jgi:hypothetical protein
VVICCALVARPVSIGLRLECSHTWSNCLLELACFLVELPLRDGLALGRRQHGSD